MKLRDALERRLMPAAGSAAGAIDPRAGSAPVSATGASAARAASAVAALYVFWLVLSGYFTAFLMISGLACACAVVWFARRMDVIDREGHPIHLGWRALSSYWPWLLKEIVTSAWTVARIIVSPSLPVSPTLVELRPAQATDVGLATHANSITLTPGTITLDARADGFLVHSLTAEGAASLVQGDIDRRVAALEAR